VQNPIDGVTEKWNWRNYTGSMFNIDAFNFSPESMQEPVLNQNDCDADVSQSQATTVYKPTVGRKFYFALRRVVDAGGWFLLVLFF
jgi:hypothetical protein